MVYIDPNNTNSIVYQHTLLSYQLKTSHWNISWAATLHLYNMADRGEKLQQPHCYHPFSDSRDTYLTKNHYENYSPKMVPTNPTGSWTKCQLNKVKSICQTCRSNCVYKTDTVVYKSIYFVQIYLVQHTLLTAYKYVWYGMVLNISPVSYLRLYFSFSVTFTLSPDIISILLYINVSTT